jgi:hypothetical protein
MGPAYSPSCLIFREAAWQNSLASLTKFDEKLATILVKLSPAKWQIAICALMGINHAHQTMAPSEQHSIICA